MDKQTRAEQVVIELEFQLKQQEQESIILRAQNERLSHELLMEREESEKQAYAMGCKLASANQVTTTLTTLQAKSTGRQKAKQNGTKSLARSPASPRNTSKLPPIFDKSISEIVGNLF